MGNYTVGPTVYEKQLTLQASFKSLSAVFLDKIDNAHADVFKAVAIEHLQNLLPNAQAYHMKQMKDKHSVEDMLSTLVNSGFCSYLDYKPLPTVVARYNMQELTQQLRSYEKEHEKFCKETTLVELVQTLTDHPELRPVVSVGTPFLIFHLSHPWPELRLHTAIITICTVLQWVSHLQLQAVERRSDQISLVFCGFKSALTSLVSDLQRPNTARSLQELGIAVEQQMEYNPIVSQVL